MPPFAKVEDLVQAHLVVKELSLVDEQPASASPFFTASMISSKGTTTCSKSVVVDPQGKIRIVNSPGTAIFISPISDASRGSRETTIGPYLSPIDAPCGKSAYLSATYAYA